MNNDSDVEYEMFKKAVLAALKAFPQIARIKISYNGSGDEGYVGDIDLKDTDGKCIDTPGVRDALIETELLEELAFDALSAAVPGWEINQGSYGTLEIDVKAEDLTLHHTAWVEHKEEYAL